MKKFSNLETTLISKWFNNQLDEIVNEVEVLDKNELVSRVSEQIENLIKGDLRYITEGYISETIHNSFDKINYVELVEYYKN